MVEIIFETIPSTRTTPAEALDRQFDSAIEYSDSRAMITLDCAGQIDIAGDNISLTP